MKLKRFFALLLCLTLLLCLAPAVLAEDDPVLVFDTVGLLEDTEYDMLETVAEDLSAAYDFNVYIAIVDDYRDYVEDEDTDSPARDVYLYNEFGRGSNLRGSLLLLSMDSKSYDIYASGSDVYNEATMQKLGDRLIEKLNEESWTDALSAYLTDTQTLLSTGALDGAVGSAPASSTAAPATEAPASTGSATYVYDTCGLLTDAQEQALQIRAESIAAAYRFGVYIVIVGDYSEYSKSSGIENAAEDIYRSNDLGYGEGRDGLMLLLSMDERDYDLCAYGYGHTAFTDYGKNQLANEFKDDFRYNDWYSGLTDYLNTAEEMLLQAKNGNPVDNYGYGGSTVQRSVRPWATCIIVGVIVGALVALIVTSIMKRKMRSVAKATGAANYTVPNSMNLRVATDQFSHVTETRVRIQTESRSGGGGGGTHISSGGFSHSSGKF